MNPDEIIEFDAAHAAKLQAYTDAVSNWRDNNSLGPTEITLRFLIGRNVTKEQRRQFLNHISEALESWDVAVTGMTDHTHKIRRKTAKQRYGLTSEELKEIECPESMCD